MIKHIEKNNNINKLLFFIVGLFFLIFFNSSIHPSSILRKSPNSTLRILPLGNSITYDKRSNDQRSIGEKYGYRYPLYQLLKSAGVKFTFTGSEHSGGNYLPAGYDGNGGFPGIKSSELLLLLKTGRLFQPYNGIDKQITHGRYLDFYPSDIILLHIGTNGNDENNGTSASDIEKILDHIDSVSTNITVIVSLIIDRSPNQPFVTELNNNIKNMVLDRINNPSNDAYPDKLVLVDMQNDAGIDYTIDSMGTIGDGIPGDMNDKYHPNDKGYKKMATMWFNALSTVISTKPIVTLQPKNFSAIVGNQVEFHVVAVGTKPLSYQWKRNGIDIPGATDSVYQINSAMLSDDSAHFSCTVSNSANSITSNDAILFVVDENERVEANLQVLYVFGSNSNSVQDIAKQGTPLNLTISNPSNVELLPHGLMVNSQTNIASDIFASKLFYSCTSSDEISIEAWVRPKSLTQTGPARIITYSEDGSKRNFTLGQINDKYIVRLSTTTTDANGEPALSGTAGSLTTELTHVVYTRDTNGIAKLYINGVENSSKTVDGNFSTWDSTFSFGLANEFTTDRKWLGTFYLAAVYSRALRADEVAHNYLVKFNGYPELLISPKNLEGIVKNDSLALLTWTDTELNELGFIIERKANLTDSNFVVLDTLLMDAQSYMDFTPKHSTSYFYRIKAYNEKYISAYSDTVEVNNLVGVKENTKVVNNFKLYQNYPNPFNPTTTIKYAIPSSVKSLQTTSHHVELKVFDVLGREVATLVNETKQPGFYEVKFDAGTFTSGVYYYQIKVGKFVETKKMILMQ